MDIKDSVNDVASFDKKKEELLTLLLEEEGFDVPQRRTITSRERTGHPPLSFAQQRLWFLDQLEPGNPAYNISTTVHLTGRLNVAALEHGLGEIVRRHEVLRTTFAMVDGQPVQVIGECTDGEWQIPVVELWHLPEAEREAEASHLATEEARQPFDLAQGPLLRTTLLRLDEEEHVLLLTMHHIISDGWSMGVFYKELAALYEAFATGKPSPLPKLPIQYADFAQWQREWLQGEVLETQLSYWKQQLAGASPILQLPADHPRPALQSYRSGALQSFVLPKSLSEALQVLSNQARATLFMTLLAAFQTLLYRYTHQDDITVGSDIANRNRSEIEGLIGFFVNSLVMRLDLSGDPTFRELLLRVRQVALEAYAHQDLPFERLVEELQPDRDLSHTPLFQVTFVLQNMPMPVLELPELTMSVFEVENGTAKFDLALEMEERPEGLTGSIEYDTSLFDAATITRMIGHFQTLLEGIVADPDRRLSTLPLLTGSEKHELLVGWNDTRKDYFLECCAHQLIEAQAERIPEAIAVTCAGEQLTYRQLNQRANGLARLLMEQGVGPEVLVALLAERGIDFLTAILAIFKAGGAYLPLDPLHPAKRLRQILDQSRTPLVLATKEFIPTLQEALTGIPPEKQPRILQLEALLQQERPTENLPARCSPGNLAYVIYTSGSTGMPKGAMVEHVGMLNHLYTKVADLQLTEADIVAQNSSQCFDISVWQFLAPLLAGGQVHIFKNEIAHDPVQLLEQVECQGISILQVVPSMLRAIIREAATGGTRPDLAALRWVVPTGEALTTELCQQWLQLYPSIPMLNAYGSTECSDDQCHHPILFPPPADYELPTMPIGRPLANMQVYILDQTLSPVPVGIVGELYVGGIGVGRGYLNDPQRTAEVFIPDPFAQEPRKRLYKSGDLARYLPDGSIEFLGRADYMVKVRGFRIELGEIEFALAQHPTVQETVVQVWHTERTPGDKHLVAYVVPKQQPAPSPTELRSYLKEKLPDYMVPSAFVLLEAMPLTPNGKIDRRALPAPDTVRSELAETYVAPGNPVEEVLAGIWAKVLGLERVGIHDDFFELGGHSLLTTQLIFRVREVFQIKLPLSSFFETATIAGLAQTIEAIRRGGPSAAITVTDFNAEAVLDPTIRPNTVPVEHVTEPAAILLTGATGFLGTFLLHELLQQTQASIYCLVRAADAQEGQKRIQKNLESYLLWNPHLNSRIIPVVGDLSQPRLGLSTQQFQELASKMDVIYHSGALVNFVYPYHRLKPTNVLGTQEILRLATRTKAIPVHYVSTISVFDSLGYFNRSSNKRVILEREELGHSEGLLYGYAQSKWVAEKLVAAARARGLPVCIYRPATITGDSQTGIWNTGDYLSRLMKGCIQLGSMADLDEVLHLTPVDYVSKAIIHLSRRPESQGKVFHVLTPHPLHRSQLANWIHSFGYPLQQISYDKWQVELINRAGLENALYSLLPLFVEWVSAEEQMTLPEMFTQDREPQFDCQNLLDGLAGTSITCPPIDAELLGTYLAYFIRSGFLDAPPPGGNLEHALKAKFEAISE